MKRLDTESGTQRQSESLQAKLQQQKQQLREIKEKKRKDNTEIKNKIKRLKQEILDSQQQKLNRLQSNMAQDKSSRYHEDPTSESRQPNISNIKDLPEPTKLANKDAATRPEGKGQTASETTKDFGTNGQKQGGFGRSKRSTNTRSGPLRACSRCTTRLGLEPIRRMEKLCALCIAASLCAICGSAYELSGSGAIPAYGYAGNYEDQIRGDRRSMYGESFQSYDTKCPSGGGYRSQDHEGSQSTTIGEGQGKSQFGQHNAASADTNAMCSSQQYSPEHSSEQWIPTSGPRSADWFYKCHECFGEHSEQFRDVGRHGKSFDARREIDGTSTNTHDKHGDKADTPTKGLGNDAKVVAFVSDPTSETKSKGNSTAEVRSSGGNHARRVRKTSNTMMKTRRDHASASYSKLSDINHAQLPGQREAITDRLQHQEQYTNHEKRKSSPAHLFIMPWFNIQVSISFLQIWPLEGWEPWPDVPCCIMPCSG